MKKVHPSAKAFSLIELMVVLSIISIVVGLAAPKFKRFQANARQIEVKVNIRHLNTLIKLKLDEDPNYYLPLDFETPTGAGYLNNSWACGEVNPLGFQLSSCDHTYYSYTIWTGFWTEIFGADWDYEIDAIARHSEGFTLHGAGLNGEGLVFPSRNNIVLHCLTPDRWKVDSLDENIRHVSDAIQGCL